MTLLLASITRRLATVTLRQSSTPGKALVCSHRQLLQQPGALVGVRYKTGGTKKKQPSSSKSENISSTPPPSEQDQPNLLQQEWVELQKSIAVEGFDTGQITKATVTGKKQRGGKQMRRKREKENELAQTTRDRERALTDLGGGQFPPLRYSDEETERLLALAYSAIPERGGKRGTRNLKRQKLRWFRVRKARAKQKHQRIMAHERLMVKRSRIVREVLQVKRDAEDIRARDIAYQEEVLKRWAENMTSANNDSSDNGETEVVEGKQSI